jgi:hypothetical protein
MTLHQLSNWFFFVGGLFLTLGTGLNIYLGK